MKHGQDWLDFESMWNTYTVGDSRDLARMLPPGEYIDATITSPPYWNLKDYGYKNQIGFGQAYRQYLNDLQRVFKVVFDDDDGNR